MGLVGLGMAGALAYAVYEERETRRKRAEARPKGAGVAAAATTLEGVWEETHR